MVKVCILLLFIDVLCTRSLFLFQSKCMTLNRRMINVFELMLKEAVVAHSNILSRNTPEELRRTAKKLANKSEPVIFAYEA